VDPVALFDDVVAGTSLSHLPRLTWPVCFP